MLEQYRIKIVLYALGELWLIRSLVVLSAEISVATRLHPNGSQAKPFRCLLVVKR